MHKPVCCTAKYHTAKKCEDAGAYEAGRHVQCRYVSGVLPGVGKGGGGLSDCMVGGHTYQHLWQSQQ